MKNSIHIKAIFAVLISFIFTLSANATVYTTVQDGSWNSNSTWSPSKPSYHYGFADTVVVNHQLSTSANLYVYGRLVVNAGASIHASNKKMVLKEYGTLVNNGSLVLKYFTADWGTTQVVNNGSMTLSSNMVLMEGTFENNGQLTVGGYLKNNWGSVLTNNNGDSISINNYLINNNTLVNAGVMSISKKLTNSWSCSMTNSGLISTGKEFVNRGTLTNSGSLSASLNSTNDWSAGIINSGNMDFAKNFVSRGPINNTGTITIHKDFTNKANLTNSNTINVLEDMTNQWSLVLNNGVINVLLNLSNSGTIHNYGGMFVDGIASSNNGTIDGSGNLCNSDGITDPTQGSKGVSCPICVGEGSGLPVELVSFDAVNEDGQIHITWVTATEQNNNYFQVLRSVDAVNYEVVSTVSGQGNSNVLTSYEVFDAHPARGINYYVLKQVDYDGQENLSQAIEVNNESGAFNARVYPSPLMAGNDLHIKLDGKGQCTVELYNIAGQLIRKASTTDHQISINTMGLERGVYVLRLIRNTNIISKKLQIN